MNLKMRKYPVSNSSLCENILEDIFWHNLHPLAVIEHHTQTGFLSSISSLYTNGHSHQFNNAPLGCVGSDKSGATLRCYCVNMFPAAS